MFSHAVCMFLQDSLRLQVVMRKKKDELLKVGGVDFVCFVVLPPGGSVCPVSVRHLGQVTLALHLLGFHYAMSTDSHICKQV